MKKIALIFTIMSIITACSSSKSSNTNPLLTDFDTQFGVPPFDKIKIEHYMPAFEQAMTESKAEIEAITNNADAPTFANTIEALDRSGKHLTAISNIFFNLNECLSNDSMRTIAAEMSPRLTELHNDMVLNPKLFARVKSVYDQKASLTLNPEQSMLLDKSYKSFVRNGAGLSDEDKVKYRQITSELSNLTTKFGQNTLGATNAFFLHITDSTDLAGLPESAVEAAHEDAKAKELKGWVITLQAPSMIPFMQYSQKRELREKLWKAYNTRAIGGEFDNTKNVESIANLRLQMANLLGYATYADYVLEERMAKSSKTVNEFLDKLTEKSMPAARKDYTMINDYAHSQGFKGDIAAWDWAYYTEKYMDENYKLNDEMTRPYFKLENVEQGIFMLANKLYGITFKENTTLPKYHPDVKTFEVYDTDGKFLAVLYMDYFPRESKRGGAWMTAFREQSRDGKNEVRPVISIVCNFTKPTATKPSLLTFDEAETILHEFGHSLHGIFADGTYESLTGTSVYRDFVELPSQVMENWLAEKEYLDLWAVHYQTGEKIPAELVEKIVASRNFLSGYLSSRQLSLGSIDMAWHSITKPVSEDAVAFEKQVMDKTRVIPYAPGTANSPSFGHIFSGGYAAGYYSYKWAEVLDADAFEYFKEHGIFNREIAQSFRDNILSKGGSEHPMELYKKFRKQEPNVDALLKRSGLQ